MGAQQVKSATKSDTDKHVFEAWDSKEDLVRSYASDSKQFISVKKEAAEKEEYIVLYDFDGNSEKQLKLKKGEHLEVLTVNEGGEWSWVKNSKKQSGWAPTNYLAPVTSLFKYSWYHGQIARSTAEYLLRSGICGCFLVRESESCQGQWSLSLRFQQGVFHYRIKKDSDEKIFITEDRKFATLPLLIHHYSQQQDSLVTCLKFPVVKKNKPSIYNYSPTSSTDQWEVDRMEFQLLQRLGSGQYGDVYEALWLPCNRKVAVKTLKTGTSDTEEFVKEVTVMKGIRHPNLLQLLGVCSREVPFYIITEFMSHGSLIDFLQSSSPHHITHAILLYMACQVASAMVYLERKNFIHRDLAARNCLVAEYHFVKVADFGLARFLSGEEYKANENSKFPIKWTAPEGLAYGLFTTKSDVWAFGVLLYELVTLGQPPYGDVPIADIYTHLQQGFRMQRPANCPHQIYELMLQCWQWSADARPSFNQIYAAMDNCWATSQAASADVAVRGDRSRMRLHGNATIKTALPPVTLRHKRSNNFNVQKPTLQSTNQIPLQSTNQTPLQSTNQTPLQSTNQTPLQSTNQTPLHSTNQKMIQQTVRTIKAIRPPQKNTLSNQSRKQATVKQTIKQASAPQPVSREASPATAPSLPLPPPSPATSPSLPLPPPSPATSPSLPLPPPSPASPANLTEDNPSVPTVSDLRKKFSKDSSHQTSSPKSLSKCPPLLHTKPSFPKLSSPLKLSTTTTKLQTSLVNKAPSANPIKPSGVK